MVKTASFDRLQKGDVAPDFTLSGIDGRTYSRKSVQGSKGTLIIFMCNHCPYVKARMDEIIALHKEFGDPVTFVGINSSDPDYPGEGMENMKFFAREYGITFPYLLDENGDTARAYGATCTPDPFLFDGEGKLVFHGKIVDALEPQDPVHEHTMKENITKLLDGEAIEPWFNPSLGCSIKFKG